MDPLEYFENWLTEWANFDENRKNPVKVGFWGYTTWVQILAHNLLAV